MENPLKIDVGVSARAELKGEVPSSSLGRLVDALTDAIRPFTEQRGLRGDLIRLQREDVLIEIAKRANNRLKLDNANPRPIPNRVLIPLLEKASWTEPSEEVLVDCWANLLADASVNAHPNHVIAIDILSKLDSAHARLLHRVVNKPYGRRFDDVPSLYSEEWTRIEIQNILKKLKNRSVDEDLRKIGEEIQIYIDIKGILYVGSGVFIGKDPAIDFKGDEIIGNNQSIPDGLASLNILKEIDIKSEKRGKYDVWLNCYGITSFGAEFVQACVKTDR